MNIYLTRHAQAEHNASETFAGSRIDSSLTQIGREEAAKRALTIADAYPVELIVCSELRRTYQTALIIAEEYARRGRQLIPYKTHLLNEVDVGLFSGKNHDEAMAINQEALLRFEQEELATLAFPEGDSHLELEQRALTFLEFISSRSERSILVVGHSIFNKFILQAKGLDTSADFEHATVIGFSVNHS